MYLDRDAGRIKFRRRIREYGLQLPWVAPTRHRFYNGAGVRVGMIDSGLPKDPYLRGLVADAQMFVDGTSVDDTLGHAQDVMGRTVAFAPYAKYFVAKVTDSLTDIAEIPVLQAALWLASVGVDIINVSLGFDNRLFCVNGACNGTCFLCSELLSLAKRGIIIVAACGNDGPELGTITCPANASGGKIVSVGATDLADHLLDVSSRDTYGNTRPDVVAPGVSSWPGRKMHGTSYAAPVVTGMVASVLGRFPAERAIAALKSSCKDIGLESHEAGYGLINPARFVEVLPDVQVFDEGQQQRFPAADQ